MTEALTTDLALVGAFRVLSQPRLAERAASQATDLYPQVVVLAGLGRNDQALDLLEQAVVQRSPNAIFLAVEPFLDPLPKSRATTVS